MPDGTNRWMLNATDEDFPDSLVRWGKPIVPRLYGEGDREALDEPCISIIGARRATPYGLAVAEMAGRIAAESDIVVVTGGAMGCDRAASKGALDAGGRTVIVSGCGADRVYPESSRDVFDAARAGRGAVVSLVEWGVPPMRPNFPQRNVVIAALSRSLFVAEAGMKSGTMSTAEAAEKYSTRLYAVPGNIFSATSQGTNKLISMGASIVTSELDLETLISMDYGKLRMQGGAPIAFEGRVLSALSAGPLRPDDLAHALEESVLTVIQTVTDYETKGILERLPDGSYSITRSAYLEHFEAERRATAGRGRGMQTESGDA